MAKIAWFGAGMMGSGFVEALRRRGDEVTVWNRTLEKARALERFCGLVDGRFRFVRGRAAGVRCIQRIE